MPETAGSLGTSRLLTPTEAMVAEIWRDLMNLDEIDPDLNFFEAGGHSILAAQAVHQIAQRTGLELELEDFFDLGSITEIARELDRLLADRPDQPGPEEEL